MYQCSNCNGNLVFDIASQNLQCAYCSTQYDPYEMDQTIHANEMDTMDVTMYTCSQCGGELYTTDTAMTSFCSFCGTEALLYSRASKEQKPEYIIPFKKTKEDCKKLYKNMMRMAIFAPKELKDEKCIDSFRGIYMPYWMYDVNHEKPMDVAGKTSYRSGDYIYTSHYRLTADLDVHYNGISYDGSSSFSDNISEKIAPFQVAHLKPFTPAYMSGFYADTADVDESVYCEDVTRFANDKTGEFIRKHPDCKKYEISQESIDMDLGNAIERTHRAMFPVWFMSYQKDGRVAYATVNGQTGKVVADLPVDLGKYLIGTFVLALPIFILLNMFLTVTPGVLLSVVSGIAAFVSVLYAIEIGKIVKRDNYEDDKGKQSKIKQDMNVEQKKVKGATMPKSVKTVLIVVGATILISFVGPLLMISEVLVAEIFGVSSSSVTVCGVTLIISIAALVFSNISAKKLNATIKGRSSVFCMIATLIALLIAILNPVHDAYYYVGSMVILIAVFVTLLDLIKKYNVLATRRLPQFDYTGGDNNAY